MLIFHAIDSNIVANALNLVVLTAALSVYNSCVYCNSRMLFGQLSRATPACAAAGEPPRDPIDRPGGIRRRHGACVVINYVMPGKPLPC